MTAKSMTAKPIDVSKANFYARMTAVELRKAAQGKVPNAKSHRKAELIDLLVEWDAKAERATEKPATPTKAKIQTRTQAKPAKATSVAKSDAKPVKKTSRKMCQVCSKRPVDRKTQGRDSTMCEPCFDYAGWENSHSDEGHGNIAKLRVSAKKATGDDKQRLADELAALEYSVAECPVCQGNNPANDDVKTKVNGSKPGRKVAKPMATESKSFDAKAKAFAAIAKEAGWKSHVHNVSKTSAQVIATLGTETISMVWDNGVYQYETSEYKNDKGRKARIRNASAARKIVEA
jgi:hypothetical protein